MVEVDEDARTVAFGTSGAGECGPHGFCCFTYDSANEP
jgi:hypothetical protein